jgi:hypothetical protein
MSYLPQVLAVPCFSHSVALPYVDMPLDQALTTFEMKTPFAHNPKDWIRADTDRVHDIAREVMALRIDGGIDYLSLLGPAMIYKVRFNSFLDE